MDPRSEALRALGAALTTASTLGYALALDLVRRRFARGEPWWGASARDLVNLAGAGLTTLGLYAFGFPLALAMLLGVLCALAVYGLDHAAASPLGLARPARLAAPASLAVVVPLLALGAKLAPALSRALEAVFQGP